MIALKAPSLTAVTRPRAAAPRPRAAAAVPRLPVRPTPASPLPRLAPAPQGRRVAAAAAVDPVER